MKSTFFLVSCVIVFSTVMTNGAPIGVDRTEDTSSNVLTSVSLEFIRYEEADPIHGGVFRIVNAGTNTVSLAGTLMSSKDEKYSPVVIDVELHGHIKDGWYRCRGFFRPDKIPHVLRISPGTQMVVRCCMIDTLNFPSGVDKWRLVIYDGFGAIVSKPFEFNPETVAAVWYREEEDQGGIRTRFTKTKPPPAGYENYVVKEGDTLSNIAMQYRDQDKFDDIVTRNGISNVDLIHSGQILLIKCPKQ